MVLPQHRAGLGTASEGAKEGGGAPAGWIRSSPRRLAPRVRTPRQSMAPGQQIRWGLPADRRPITQSSGAHPG